MPKIPAFKLPELTWDLDCEPLGYPALSITFQLNPDLQDYEAPEAPKGKKLPPWESEFYFGLARVIKSVTVPADLAADGQPATLEINSAADVWDLEHSPGFDPMIITWAMRQYSEQRQERLKVARKN